MSYCPPDDSALYTRIIQRAMEDELDYRALQAATGLTIHSLYQRVSRLRRCGEAPAPWATRLKAVLGEGKFSSKLTAAEVREVRLLYAHGGHTQAQLGRRYGVSQTTISGLILRRTWGHVP